jgi:Chitobiase/beta-hexosaminidase C-terminal domain
MKSLLSAPLKRSIFTAPQSLSWIVPCLLLPLLFTGCAANRSMVTPTTDTSTPGAAATPIFSPAPGVYTTAQTVTLSAATTGATIYYTTDGTVPTTSSTQYTRAIPVSGSQVIAAVAVASGDTNSSLAKAGYVIKPPAVSGPVIPKNAIAASGLLALDTWIFNHDQGTPGTAVGATSLVSTPSLSGNARQFVSSYTNAGGEIYSVPYANDTASMNFVYDGWVWIEAGSTIANLELDSNQVTENGQTAIYAFQCSGYSQSWEYSGAGGHWVSSSRPCKVSNWQTNAWHHVQISYSRDDSGNVTNHSVWLDGNEQVIDATAPSSFALGWQVGVVQTQFQLDGQGASGASKVYLDNLNVYRW